MINVLEPKVTKEDSDLVKKTLEDGWVSWHGPYYEKFADALESYLGLRDIGKRIVLTSSGSTALHAALVLSYAHQDTDIYIPELTYVATLSAAKQTRSSIIMQDVRASDWNVDPRLWQHTSFMKAGCSYPISVVITVDLYGFPCKIFTSHSIVIEDSCESLGAKDHEGFFTGTRGNYAVFSFFANKIITTGEGGALVVPDREYQRAKDLVNHFPGGVEYDHPDFGYNYRMTHMSAALGYSQLQRLEANLKKKKWIFDYYKANIKLGIQHQITDGESSYWVSTFLFDSGETRQIVEDKLKIKEIGYRRVFKPMSELVGHKAPLMAAEIFKRGLSLPSSVSITEKELEEVCLTINQKL